MKTKVSKKYLDRNGKWFIADPETSKMYPIKLKKVVNNKISNDDLPVGFEFDDENFILLMDELVEYYTRLTYAGYYNWNDQYGWETFTEALNRRSNKEAGYGR